MQFFYHAVAKNINIRFILIISVLVVPAAICNLIIIIIFLLSLVLFVANFRGVFYVCACILFDYGMLKTRAGEIIICAQSFCIS